MIRYEYTDGVRWIRSRRRGVGFYLSSHGRCVVHIWNIGRADRSMAVVTVGALMRRPWATMRGLFTAGYASPYGTDA